MKTRNQLFIFLAVIFASTLKTQAQHEEKCEEKKLELEGELYFRNLIHFPENVIKNEVMIDYHENDTSRSGRKTLLGLRFFNDANLHWEHRQMTDLIWYTEAYWGLRNFQIGAELGSVSGLEYISAGPQLTSYNNPLFKRCALNTRVIPDLIFGYEFTTQELKIGPIHLSSTGTGRFIVPTKQFVVQASLWISSKNLKSLYWGFEYEYNSSKIENPQELFFGMKLELK